MEWDQLREYDRAHFHPAEKRIQYMGKRIWDYFDDWDSASQNNNWLGEENRRGGGNTNSFINTISLIIVTSTASTISITNFY